MTKGSSSVHRFNALPGNPELSPFFPVLAPRVLHKHIDQGWNGLVGRVVGTAKLAESRWNESCQDRFLSLLESSMRAGVFLPNSPLLVNAGSLKPRLFACFCLDSRRSISEFLPLARAIHDGMGGVGYSLESFVDASEAQQYLSNVDLDTDGHQEGRPRPASNAATVSITHPAVDAVLSASGKMRTTNLNLGLTDEFMQRLSTGDQNAAGVFLRVCESIYRTGQPGIVFLDRIPRISRETNSVFAANVCGEAPLAADESGLLGALNLVAFAKKGIDGVFELDEKMLQTYTAMAVRFLDNMHDLHEHSAPSLALNSQGTRKIGVGIMGFAHLLVLLGVPYGSHEAELLATRIGSVLFAAAKAESERLAKMRGSFPAWSAELGIPERRNACLSAIAGTATLALLVGTTGGIEPMFSHLARNRVMGRELLVLDPLVSHVLEDVGYDIADVTSRLLEGECLREIVGSELADILPTALEIPGEAHIRIQAAFQHEIDGGITKTINCAARTSVVDIDSWIKLAHSKGCMGLTIYRNDSLATQPFSHAL